MKLVIAIIQPSKLEDVKAALTEVEVFRLTVMDCQGFGRQKGKSELYRGREFSVNLTRKVQLQIAVNDDFVDAFPIGSAGGGFSGSNVDATKEPGEPNHAANLGGVSVWW